MKTEKFSDFWKKWLFEELKAWKIKIK
jgi:hypothetical protein